MRLFKKALLVLIFALCGLRASADPITIQVVNKGGLSEAWVRNYVSAQNQQCKEDFYPAWGVEGRVTIQSSPMKMYLMRDFSGVFPGIEYSGVMGFHDEHGNAYVSLLACKWLGYSPSHVASHEVLEILGNPWAGEDKHENCDPVAPSYYIINGLKMANFVFPGYFHKGSVGPWDFLGKIQAPFIPMTGGYNSY